MAKVSKNNRKSHPKYKVQPEYDVVRKLVAGGQGPVIGRRKKLDEFTYKVKLDKDKDHIWDVQWEDTGVWFSLA